MTKELPNPASINYKGVRDETDRIETIAATRGGAEALHALLALSNEANPNLGTPKTDISKFIDQLGKDQGGKFLTEIVAAYIKEKERPISHGKPMTGADVQATLGELDWRQDVDPVTKKLLEAANDRFGDIAKAAGKDAKAGLTDADLGRAVAVFDAQAATDLKKTLTETDDAKMVQTILADNGKLLDTISTCVNRGASNHAFGRSDLTAFLNHAHQNPNVYDPTYVKAAEQLNKDFYKFALPTGIVSKDSLAKGLGIDADNAGTLREQAIARPIPTVPAAQPVEVAQVKPPAPKPHEVPHSHAKPTAPEKVQASAETPSCKSLRDALTIQDGEGPWACAQRLCELTKVHLNNREMLQLALILKKATPPEGGIYRSGVVLNMPENFSQPNTNLSKLEAEVKNLSPSA